MATAEKKGVFKRIGAWFKSTFAELKKVTWPTPKQVVKRLGTVLTVTAFFLVLLMGMDVGLSELYKLLTKGITPETTSMITPISQLVSKIGL